MNSMILCKIVGVSLISCIVLLSCVETPILDKDVAPNEDVSEKTTIVTRSSSDNTYIVQQNPYALRVMQEVYDTFSETPITLEATDLYVKFMPKDSVELHTLRYECNLELFDYPLDIELAEGEVYVNYDLPESDLIWVYTTVEPDFIFPTGISYEVLEECYIPEDGETIGSPTRLGEVYVEDAAFALMGYDEEVLVDTRANVTPQGTITVFDDYNGFNVPVKGVKIRCHRIVKWATAYTNENGSYTMSKSFRFKPHYAIVFENVKDFDIWGDWGPIDIANYNLGWHSNAGRSFNIGSNNGAWEWAVVNNSVYEYYQMCDQTGICKPPSDLKIWVWKNFIGSSAPMLRRIEHIIGHNSHSDWLSFFINTMGYGISASLIVHYLGFMLPDVTIGCLDRLSHRLRYEQLYNTVNHELAHSSHFRQVGSEFWALYISYIMTYGAYGGNDNGNNAQLCAIGEMWGNFMGYTQANEKFDDYPSFGERPIDGWIYPQLFMEIYNEGILSKKEIFDCLTLEVDTYNDLVSKLYSLYPDRAVDIENIFNNYPTINHTISLPENNQGIYDSFCMDTNIVADTAISGGNILVQNSIVANGATLELNANTSITIDESFIVEREANLIMSVVN